MNRVERLLETAKNQDGRATLHEFIFIAPPLDLCTDNAAMIAWVGIQKLRLGQQDGLDFIPRPRWPLHGQKFLAEVE